MTRAVGKWLLDRCKEPDAMYRGLQLLEHAATNDCVLDSLGGRKVTKQQVEVALDMVRDACPFALRPRMDFNSFDSEMLAKAKEMIDASQNGAGQLPWSQMFLHLESKSFIVVKVE